MSENSPTQLPTGRASAIYCDCPNCGYKNALAVTRTKERTLYHCHAGCSQDEVWRAVSNFEPRHTLPLPRETLRPSGAQQFARLLWRKSLPAPGTVVERYLAEREITGPIPPFLRYLPEHMHSPTGTKWPVMLAAVTNAAGEIKAVHRTYLSKAGDGKAPVQPDKMTLGLFSGFACRLGEAAKEIAIAEGIETALSFQIITGIPSWAALSTGGMRALLLPPAPAAQCVTIAADPDQPGLRAAEYAAERWQSEGRQVRIVTPGRPGMDFNDLLIGVKL